MVQIKHRITGETLKEIDGANLRYAVLRYANLGGANLRDADLSDADLRYDVLRGANLSDAVLRGANLCGSDLRGADLCYADLRYANLSYAKLSDANLSYANLGGAVLYNADLRGADLSGTCGNMREVQSMHTDRWVIVVVPLEGVMQIGCERHSLSEWWGFDDARIAEMDANALEWWRKWKPILMQIWPPKHR